MKLLGFYGTKGSGKDTIYSQLEENGYQVKRFAFGDEIKEELIRKFGVERELIFGTYHQKLSPVPYVWFKEDRSMFHVDHIPKNYIHSKREDLTIRTMVQYYGTEVIKRINPNAWIDLLFCRIEEYAKANPDTIIVITDCRFKDENEFVRKKGGFIVGLTREISKDNHISEPTVKKEDCDIFVDNKNLGLQEQFEFLRNELENLEFFPTVFDN